MMAPQLLFAVAAVLLVGTVGSSTINSWSATISAIQRTYYVSADAAPTNTECNQTEPCSLEYAVTHSISQSKILLQSKYFEVDAPLHVDGKNLLIMGDLNVSVVIACGTKSSGSAFLFSGSSSVVQDLTIANCASFSPLFSRASGATFVDSSASILFNHTKFINNTIIPPKGNVSNQWIFGGAAATCYGLCNFVECHFSGNVVAVPSGAHVFGGAVFIYYLGNRTVSFKDSLFFNNTVAAKSDPNGTGPVCGGSVGIGRSKHIVVQGCTFLKNMAIGNVSVSSILGTTEGGALCIGNEVNSEVAITRCIFAYNEAQGGVYGGLSYGGAVLLSVKGMVAISDTNFTHNLVNANDNAEGGAIAVWNVTQLTIAGCLFENNEVNASTLGVGRGGAISMQWGSLEITKSKFVGNVVRSFVTSMGGALAGYENVRNVSMKQSQFHGNSAMAKAITDGHSGGGSAYGGAVYILTVSKTVWTMWSSEGNSYRGNQALGGNSSLFGGGAGGGGAVCLQLSALKSKATIRSDVYEGNAAYGGDGLHTPYPIFMSSNPDGGAGLGGALYLDVPQVLMANCTLTGNLAQGGSGANTNDVLLGVAGGDGGQATGGAIHVALISYTFVVLDSLFDSNRAEGGMPGVGNSFSLSNAGLAPISQGGAIAITVCGSGSMQGCLFHNNSVRGTQGDDTSITGSRGAGGAMFSQCNLLSITNTGFHENSVQAWAAMGGAILTSHQTLITNSTLVNNSAKSTVWSGGGAMWCQGRIKVNLTSCLFESNGAHAADRWSNNSAGGAVFGNGHLTFAGEVSFSNNSASYGGALIMVYGTIDRMPSNAPITFISNRASVAGGAFYSSDPAACQTLEAALCPSPSNCTFLANRATCYGDILASGPWPLLTIDSTTKNATDVGQIFLWPGATFRLSLLMKDCYAQDVVRYDINVKATYDSTMNNHTRFSSGVPMDVVGVNRFSGMYEFSAMSVSGQPGFSFTLNFSTVPANPTSASLSTSIVVNLLGCPASNIYVLNGNDVRKSVCLACPSNQYGFDGESCMPCPSALNTVGPCMTSDAERNRSVNISAGYWPNRWTNPTEIWACPGGPSGGCSEPYVCAFNASTQNPLSSWQIICRCADGRDPASTFCGCKTGSFGRLCSQCECTDSSECWFYIEDNLCEMCGDTKLWVMLLLAAICCLGFVLFVTLGHKGTPLFVGGALALMLLLLGVGRTWLLEATLVLVFLFLLTDGGVPSGTTKSFMFYLQTLDLMFSSSNANYLPWPNWSIKVAQRGLNWTNLRMSDVSCLGLGFLRTPVGEFLFFVLVLPPLLILFTTTMLLCRWLVQRYVMAGWWAMVSQRCGNTSEEDAMTTKALINDQDNVEYRDHSHPEIEAISPIAHVGTEEDAEGDPFDDAIHVGSSRQELHMLASSHDAHKNHAAKRGGDDLLALKYRLISVGLFLLYSVHFRLSELVLKKFEPCQNDYMAQYLWIPCTTSDSQYTTLIGLAIAFTVTTVLGIPVLMATLLHRNRNLIRSQRPDRATEECLGFLYGCFQPRLYWFEMAWLGRRLLLALALAVIPEDDAFGAPFIVAILVVSLALHHSLKPLKDPRENFAEGLSLLTLLITYMAAKEQEGSTNLSSMQVLKTVILLLNLCVSGMFICLLLWPLMRRLRNSLASKALQLLRFI